MVGLHATLLIFLGRYNSGLHKAYSLWWIIGQLGATTIPVIGPAPYRSLEQIGPLGIFGILQLLAYCDFEQKRKNLNEHQLKQLRIKVFSVVGAIGFAVFIALSWIGFFGPISVRVRSLFFKHSRTGNPLVDSVAEHQPASASAYWQYLQQCMYLAPIGLIMSFFDRSNASLFLILYGFVSYYFAQKMNRLIILMGPIASALSGVALANMIYWILRQLPLYIPALQTKHEDSSSAAEKKEATKKRKVVQATPFDNARVFYGSKTGKAVRFGFALFLIYFLLFSGVAFVGASKYYAVQISQPSLMFQTRLNNGEQVIIRDYVDGYEWIKANTPADSRVLSWWDYGYQIAGIANRTTLADGNTWNLEHIALIGKILTASQEKAHHMARHLADYVLVWAGGGGDDLAKMPHVARIASSVYDGICDGDQICRAFSFNPRGNSAPHPKVKQSLLFNLVMHKRHQDAKLDTRYFEEVFSSKYGLLRVFKVKNVDMKSRAWLADPANRKCDRPGSWYCPGVYPPAIQKPPESHKAIDYEKSGYH
jgi:dolichyl-diphosphooligosaccharide--protein glycosyltransferase